MPQRCFNAIQLIQSARNFEQPNYGWSFTGVRPRTIIRSALSSLRKPRAPVMPTDLPMCWSRLMPGQACRYESTRPSGASRTCDGIPGRDNAERCTTPAPENFAGVPVGVSDSAARAAGLGTEGWPGPAIGFRIRVVGGFVVETECHFVMYDCRIAASRVSVCERICSIAIWST